ncbi:MAG: hypothetical protein IID41_05105 [Planctomycetes bacterium]|nr:hypothetical protein [Planctomycetota bacterium]
MPIKRVAIAPCCGKGLAGEAMYATIGDDFGRIVSSFGGSVAEQRFTGRPNEYGAKSDRENVGRILARRYGREPKSGDLDMPIVTAAKAEAEKIVGRRWPEIQALAGKLIEEFELEAGEILAIVGRAATDRINKRIAELERLT